MRKRGRTVRTEQLVDIDISAKADDKVLVYHTATGKHEYEAKPTAGASYTELDGSVNTTANAEGAGDGAWIDWDLSATLPVGSVVAEIAINKLVATDNVGLRKDGSALARTIPALKLEVVIMDCEVAASRIVEILSGDVSDLDTFSLVGYWS